MFFDLVKLMRLNQLLKHIFVIPGIVFGYLISQSMPSVSDFIFAFISIILIASSNYIMNEITDRSFDAHHNLKKNRIMVKSSVNYKAACIFYFVNLFTGICFSLMINKFFFLICVTFFISGVAYNIKPIRLKDLPIADVICESFNNPIRFLLGFSLFFDDITIPSLSLILSYWLAGAFLMNSKRLSEYRFFQSSNNIKNLEKYRKVYLFYDFEKLNTLSMFYATFSIAFLSIFIIKHRIEYALLLPIIIFIFSWYHFYSLKYFIMMQEVKNLIRAKVLLSSILLLTILFIYLTFNEIKILSILLDKNIIVKF